MAHLSSYYFFLHEILESAHLYPIVHRRMLLFIYCQCICLLLSTKSLNDGFQHLCFIYIFNQSQLKACLTFRYPFFPRKAWQIQLSFIKFTKMAILCLPLCSQQFLGFFCKFAKILIAFTKATKLNTQKNIPKNRDLREEKIEAK